MLTVIDIFSKNAWAMLLMKISGMFVTIGCKIIFSEGPRKCSECQKPGKIWVIEEVSFIIKRFKALL